MCHFYLAKCIGKLVTQKKSMQKTILSIDCGTQSLRAIIFSLSGEILAMEKIAFEPYISRFPGWAEQDPELYWNSLKTASLKLKQSHPVLFENIVGIGVAAIRNSMVNVDKNGKPLRALMVWLDQRKAEPVYKPGFAMRLLIRAIGMTDSINTAQREGKCNWIKQNQPELWRRTYKYLQVSGFLNFRLTGHYKDSVASQIGHIPFNYKKQIWGNPKSLLVFSAKIFPVAKNKLPELVLPGDEIGKINEKANAETGLPIGLPVIACGSDKGCGTIGMGVLTKEMASLSFGTTATIQTTTKKYLEPITYMPAYPAVLPGLFNPEVEVFRGFWMIIWFKNQFGHKEVLEAEKKEIPVEEVLNDLLKQSPAGSMGLIVHPYWSPGLVEPSAKGAMIGFGDVHKKQHVYRAIIEGLAFALFEGKEKIEKVTKTKIKKLTVSGGASKSDEICQIAADVFNLPIVRGETTETSGLGAAIITAFGTGNFNSIEETISKMVKYKTEFYPNKKNVKIYRQLYKKVYKKINKKMKPFYKEIREITGYPDK